MAKFLILSKYGDFLSCAYRLWKEGHDVTWWVKHAENRRFYEGTDFYAHQVTNWKDALEKDRILVPDMVGGGRVLDALVAEGYLVFGGRSFADRHELDRGTGSKLFNKAGIQSPPLLGDKILTTFEEARQLLEAEDEDARYVFKPHGNQGTECTYVSSSKADMLAELIDLEEMLPPGTLFELQQFIHGIEISTEAWFARDHFVEGMYNCTFEEKKEYAGNLGRATGCAGNVVLAVDGAARLVTHLFTGLEEPLRDAEYAGPVDVNCIVTPDAAYALEGTFRFGYDAIQTLWSLQTDSGWGEIVERCVKGTLENAHLSSDYAIGVRVTVPFPDTVLSRRKTCLAALQAAPGSTISPESMYDRLVTEQEKMVRIRRIGGFPNESVSDWVHLSAAGWDEELGCFVTAATPTDNNILTMTATGELLDVAKARVYDRLSNLELPDKQYRNDIGDRVEKDLKALKQQEWV